MSRLRHPDDLPPDFFTGDAPPDWKFCSLCHEYFDEAKDPNHREACRDANRP